MTNEASKVFIQVCGDENDPNFLRFSAIPRQNKLNYSCLFQKTATSSNDKHLPQSKIKLQCSGSGRRQKSLKSVWSFTVEFQQMITGVPCYKLVFLVRVIVVVIFHKWRMRRCTVSTVTSASLQEIKENCSLKTVGGRVKWNRWL